MAELNDNVLRYGKILTDDNLYTMEFCPKKEIYIRIRTISYDNQIFYHKMVNGEVVDFKELN